MFAAIDVVTALARSGWARDIDVRAVADPQTGLFLIGAGYGPTYGGYHCPLALDPCIDAIRGVLRQPQSRNARAALTAANDVAAEYLARYGMSGNRQELGAHEWARIQDRSWGLFHTAVGISLALLADDSLQLAQIGTSRIYLRRQGDLRLLLLDHSLLSQIHAAPEEIRAELQLNLESIRTVVTRMLGIKPQVEIDYAIEPIRDGDEVLICSAGIWNHSQGDDVVRALVDAPANAISAMTENAVKLSRLDAAVLRFRVRSVSTDTSLPG